MSIDFRRGKIDHELERLLRPVYSSIGLVLAKLGDGDTVLPDQINSPLDNLLPKIINYYKNNRKKDYPIEENAAIRAHEVFSEFLQNLIYFTSHITLEDSSTI